MGRKLDIFTGALAASLVLGALLACKKKEEPAPVATAAPPPAPEPPKPEEPKKEDKKDDVTRYGTKETAESGTVRVKLHNTKVYKEADMTTDFVSTLNRGTLVNRKARYSNWLLIDYPTGVGELSPGWVLAAHIDDKIEKIDPEEVKKQDAGAKPVTSAPPSASTAPPPPPPSASTPTPKPVTSAPPKPPPPPASGKPFHRPKLIDPKAPKQ
jgi:hypothetical protein